MFVRKTFLITFCWFIAMTGISIALTGCGEDANPGIKTICEIIMLLQGRIGRSIATFSIMLAAWKFANAKSSWQDVTQLAIGVGIFFAPKTFALFLLPDYVEGLSGDGFDSTVRYSPDEILTCVCPNLR